MSLQRRRERYIILHVFKILHSLAPNDINMEFYQNERQGIMCKLPNLVKNAKLKFQTLYDNSFHVTGAKLRNKLPKEIKQKKSLDTFKNALTKFIMLFPDHPPVHGLSSSNSLLDISMFQSIGGMDGSHMARRSR